jgi:hypothetical protein
MGGWLSFLWPFKGNEPRRIIILGLGELLSSVERRKKKNQHFILRDN